MEKSARNQWDKLVRPSKTAPHGWLKRQEWIKELGLGPGVFDDRIKKLFEVKKAKKAKFIDEAGHLRDYVWIDDVSPYVKKS